MKKLKKQFLAALLTAVMAVCAFAGTTPVAAATLSAKQYINKMAKATEKLKSYEMKMNMDMIILMFGLGNVTHLAVSLVEEKIFLKRELKLNQEQI